LLFVYHREKEIKFILNIGDEKIDINKALPLTLFITEAITNSIKHAFNEFEAGTIEINFLKNNNKYFLKIEDNGTGVLSNDNYQNGVGVNFMRMIVSQLNGSLETALVSGVTYQLSFE